MDFFIILSYYSTTIEKAYLIYHRYAKKEAFLLLQFKRSGIKLIILPLSGDQLIMAAALDNPSVV